MLQCTLLRNEISISLCCINCNNNAYNYYVFSCPLWLLVQQLVHHVWLFYASRLCQLSIKDKLKIIQLVGMMVGMMVSMMVGMMVIVGEGGRKGSEPVLAI